MTEPERAAQAVEPAPVSLPGLAHVATCSFLAARLAPSGQFLLGLGGGVALARAGAEHGLRAGYGASGAAVVQTVALIGPARVAAPLTQALNAPVAGWMQERGASKAARVAAVLGIRLVHYAILNVLFVVVIIGGLDEYVATYDRIARFFKVLPEGTAAAIGLTVLTAVFFGLLYSIAQVVIYDRALRRWPAHAPEPEAVEEEPATLPAGRPRVPWLALIATVAVWVLLLASTAWAVLGGVAAGLALATVLTPARRAGRQVWGVGVGLALVLAISALIPALLGAVDWDAAGPRAVRAALLVLSATWLRAVAGASGIREAFRRGLLAVRAVPAAAEAATITDQLASDRRLMPAARAFVAAFSDVPLRPRPVADALTGWVAAETRGYRPPP